MHGPRENIHLPDDGYNHYESICVAPRLPSIGRRGRRIDCRVSRRHGARDCCRPSRTPNGRNSRPSAKSRKVLILGAGISGLTAAYELSRKGYEVQVLEASFRAGGRNMTRAQRRSHRRDRLSAGLPVRQGPGPLLQRGPGAHPRPSQGAAQLLQGARRRARAVHQRQPQCLGAGRRDVRRQADPRARIPQRLARFRRRAHGEVHEAGSDRPAR